MLIFQNSSLIKYSLGFFLVEPSPLEKYWSTLAVVSTALIGFSLTAYNVYRTRIERTAADPICRKYSFIEDSFNFSWRLMIIAMMMFLVALSLSLYFSLNPTGPSLAGQWLSLIQYVTCILLGWAIFWCGSLFNYIRKFLKCVYLTTENKISNYQAKGRRKLKESKETPGLLNYWWEWLKYNWQLFRFTLKSSLTIVLSISYIYIIVIAMGYLCYGAAFFIENLGAKGQEKPLIITYLLELIKSFLSLLGLIKDVPSGPEIVIFLIIAGLLIMYSEYSLFQPKNILFNVEDSTTQNLQNTINDIKDKCEAFKHVSDWLRLKLKDAKEKAGDVIKEVQKNDNEIKFVNFSKFEPSDFVDEAGLCEKLKGPRDSTSDLVHRQLGEDTKTLLDKYSILNTLDNELINSLVRDFNNLLEKPDFRHQISKSENLKLSKMTQSLIQEVSRKEESKGILNCLNRMLLEDIFQNEITRKNSLFITAELLLRAEESIEGNHSDPIKGESIKLIELKDRHTKSLNQFIDRGYATYEEIISEMNGIELYLEGLDKYEIRLKELPAQIDLLINELSINSGKTETEPIKTSTK